MNGYWVLMGVYSCTAVVTNISERGDMRDGGAICHGVVCARRKQSIVVDHTTSTFNTSFFMCPRTDSLARFSYQIHERLPRPCVSH